MKIAMVCPYDWSVEGGVKNHVRQLSSHFRAWGHDVTIFAPASDVEVAARECVVIGRPRPVPANGSVARITFSWRYRRVRRELAAQHFDIVHMHEPLVPILPYYFLRHSRSVNVGTFHAARDKGHRMYSYTRPLTRRWFRKLDGKIAVSPAATRLVSRYFRGYYNIIPNGLDYDAWASPRPRMPEFDDGRTNILFVGRPEKRKGLQFLLRAYIELRQQRDDLRLIVVGAGSFKRYEKLMKDYPDVVFRSNVPANNLPNYHHSADVFCAPNTGNESQGYVVMEALAAGVPVVASNIEGFAGVVTNEIDGLLVEPKSPSALANGIRRLADDAALRERLREAGRQRAAAFRWDCVARRVLDYYERLLHEHSQVVRRERHTPEVAKSA